MAIHHHDNHQHREHDHPYDQHHDEGIDWGRVQAWVQTGIMFLTGLYFIDLALPGGDLGNYINVNNFGWLTWVGAAILLTIATLNTIDLMRQAKPDHHHDHDHATAGSFGSWLFLGVLAIPLVLGLGVSSKPLGADAIGELSSDVRSVGLTTASQSVIPPENRNILDWLRSFATAEDMKALEGEPVKEVIGFVYRDARFAKSDDFMLVRFALSCCVADARPLGLVVEHPDSATYAQDTWLKVSGHIEIRSVDGVDTPVIVAETITVTSQPDQPYLYF
jgi:uncharacterized repeat protein (TIGR03943 family)